MIMTMRTMTMLMVMFQRVFRAAAHGDPGQGLARRPHGALIDIVIW